MKASFNFVPYASTLLHFRPNPGPEDGQELVGRGDSDGEKLRASSQVRGACSLGRPHRSLIPTSLDKARCVQAAGGACTSSVMPKSQITVPLPRLLILLLGRGASLG